MATTTKAPDPIPGFHAVEESRRWKEQTAKRLAAMTPEQRREHLHRTMADFLARKSQHRGA